jgi:hypothetical protein
MNNETLTTLSQDFNGPFRVTVTPLPGPVVDVTAELAEKDRTIKSLRTQVEIVNDVYGRSVQASHTLLNELGVDRCGTVSLRIRKLVESHSFTNNSHSQLVDQLREARQELKASKDALARAEIGYKAAHEAAEKNLDILVKTHAELDRIFGKQTGKYPNERLQGIPKMVPGSEIVDKLHAADTRNEALHQLATRMNEENRNLRNRLADAVSTAQANAASRETYKKCVIDAHAELDRVFGEESGRTPAERLQSVPAQGEAFKVLRQLQEDNNRLRKILSDIGQRIENP